MFEGGNVWDKDDKYVLTPEKKEELQALTILNMMINKGKKFSVLLEGDFEDLAPLFRKMAEKDFVDVDKENFISTEKGRQALKKFLQRDTELIRVFEPFCAVNMDAGTFAYSQFWELDEEEFVSHLNDERENWEDLRLMVLEFKNEEASDANQIEEIDLVFGDFIKKGRIDLEKDGWQFDLFSNLIWEEMIEIIDDYYDMDELREEIEDDDEADWTAEELLENVVKAGAGVMCDNLKEEKRRAKEAEAEAAEAAEEERQRREDADDDEYYEEIVIIEEYEDDYFDCYYDPFYVSPILYVAIW